MVCFLIFGLKVFYIILLVGFGVIFYSIIVGEMINNGMIVV